MIEMDRATKARVNKLWGKFGPVTGKFALGYCQA
jgi:hypothetical protein